MKYYTYDEMFFAIQQAKDKINDLTNSCKEYTRGTNDCFALIAEYDLNLRGKTKARDIVKLPYKNFKDWYVKLIRLNYTPESYAEYCGYEIVKNKKAKLGDIAFDSGVAIHAGDFWLTTNEQNKGTENKRQTFFLETKIPLIARPVRN